MARRKMQKLSVMCTVIIIAMMLATGCGVESNTALTSSDFATEKPDDFFTQPYRSPAVYNPPTKVKGIYLTGWKAGLDGEFEKLVSLVNNTELNAMVIDVKDNTGKITYQSDVPLAREIGAGSNRIRDIDHIIKTLKQNDIYAIARVVVFEDPVLAQARIDWDIKTKSGGLWKTRKGLGWVDPYNRNVWEYVVDIAEEAAKKGFNEIQFDYVRFPSDGNLSDIVYPAYDGKNRSETITSFLAYAKERLEPYGVYVSADIFGLVTSAQDDMRIGQVLEDIAKTVDYISPMVYPSHYAKGSFGIPNPNADPYSTVYRSMADAVERLEKIEGFKGQLRPWLQDFTLGDPPYGAKQVRAQINATYDAGVSEWILWDPANTYTVSALMPATVAVETSSESDAEEVW